MVDELLSQDEIDALLSGAPAVSADAAGGDLSPEDQDVLGEVAGIFANAAGNVVGMLAGRGVAASVAGMETFPQREMPERADGTGRVFLYTLACDGLENAPAAIVLSERGAMSLADLMMGGDGKELPAEANDLYLSASQEGLSQVIGSAFTNVSGLLKGQRLVPSGASGTLKEGSWLPLEGRGPEEMVWGVKTAVDVSDVGAFDLWLLLPVSVAQLLAKRIQEALAPPAPEPSRAAPQPQAAAPQSSRPAAAAVSPSPVGAPLPPRGIPVTPQVDVRPAEFMPLQQDLGAAVPANLELILDIPVRVTVELGRTRKTIGEVLNMTPGSVVELEKMAGEPVDVLVNGKLMARGEVVVIDESFGVRITEIVSRAERIRSMGI